MLLSLYGLQKCRPTKSPSVSAAELRDDDSPLLTATDTSIFRSAVGKLLWLSHVRPDVSYLTKELARRVQGIGCALRSIGDVGPVCSAIPCGR